MPKIEGMTVEKVVRCSLEREGVDVVFLHDLAALRGRIAGWRGARRLPRRPYPPTDAIAADITFDESLRLCCRVYSEDGRSCT